MNLITTIEFILGIIVFLLITTEISSLIVYGRHTPQKYLDKYFEKHLEEYKQGHKTGHLLHGSSLIPFISTTGCPSSKYYIHGIGMIPRWSKWTKVLDEIVWAI